MLKITARYRRLMANLLVTMVIGLAIVLGFRFWPHPPLSESLASNGLSTVYLDNKGELLRITSAKDQRFRLWTPFNAIPKTFQTAVLLHEDRYFYRHFGFNPVSLARGFVKSYVFNEPLQGGSTITMQLARMHWQLNTRSIKGKLIQIVRAVQLELSYSKNEILEAYLNYAPYGRNIESIGAASLIYFNKPPNQLTLPEILTLAVLPQSPSLRLKDKSGLVGERLVNARNRLYSRWVELYPDDRQYEDFFSLPLKLRQPEQLPFIAPHFTDMLKLQDTLETGKNSQISQYERHQTELNAQFQTTTLDKQLQNIIEQQVKAFIARHQMVGIKNASVLLVDTRDMGVKALVGSANYFDTSIHGQVNGTLAKRSPGSTLKPFIYALALDQGILHPATILRDVPIQYGAYSPENYDLKFLGPISATKALNYSRNIPAVTVAAQLKQPDLYSFLKKAGVSKLASRNHYGLALVLGGGEINMQELAKLYSMLANQGINQPLKFIQSDLSKSVTLNSSGVQSANQLISPSAAYITMDMLGQHARPGDTLAQSAAKIPVYWKTGTSWGFRDAWTAGIFGPYVLVVWEGNFSGEGNNAFVGVEAAAPLFFNIIDSIKAHYPNMKPTYLTVPDTIKKVDVCLSSGQLPTKWCQQIGQTWFIPGVSPIKADTIFRPVAIDIESGEVACPPFEADRVKIEIFEYWPSDLSLAFSQAGVPKRTPPQNNRCIGAQANLLNFSPPRIISPQKNVKYTFRRNENEREKMKQLVLIANSDNINTHLYWFIDGSFLGHTVGKQTLVWEPKYSGVYQVRVVDEVGQVDTRSIEVNFID
ncbi:penicillin-binding protein 1C [Thorsellia anophelis]|uniref:peptidoglycan glycosyltransferase n=1 Tax=Thorsellia anophelis DSM 18579 TaxID=1123402 RepID=A0A1H9Z6M9_9GAMM|nr:penicillin-binding protein 1C [Thorsellia anophelis]SES77158.1 penicillin-binding protein 1C [Thorsellia anophelis DSM 18579]